MGSSHKSTVGYWYKLKIYFGLCMGPVDAFLSIDADKANAWEDTVTDNATISVDAEDLWGGEDEQGGIVGDFDIMFGAPTQGVNTYLNANLGADHPAYRGLVTVLFKGGKWGAFNPYPKAPSFLLSRIVKGWLADTAWYPEKAGIPLPGLTTITVLMQDTAIPGNDAAATAVNYRLFDGLDPSDVIEVTIPSGQQFSAWSPWNADLATTPVLPPVFGHTWTNQFSVTFDGISTTTYLNFALSTTANIAFETAQASLPVLLTGHASYKFWLYDPNTGDNRGGSSLRITKRNAALGMNPAHVLYDSITDPSMGNEPTAKIDDVSFRAAADVFYAEGIGLCMTYDPDHETIEAFQQRVCDAAGLHHG